MKLHAPTSRRNALVLGGAALLGLTAPAVAQSDFPSRPIKLILPLPAGGTADLVARLIGERLQVALKQPVVIENKPGGQYAIAMQAVSSAPADGHTLFYFDVGILAYEAVERRFQVLQQLAPITDTNYWPNVLLASVKAPFTTISEMTAWARANPGKLNYATLGAGSIQHLLGHSVARASGFVATDVPFKGGPDAAVALVQGEVHTMVATSQFAKPFVEKGQFRILGVFADRRQPTIPAVPTLTEAGLRVASMDAWAGFAAPAGTPAPIVETLRREIAAIAMLPAVRERLGAGGSVASTSASAAEFTAKISKDRDWIEEMVKSANLSLR